MEISRYEAGRELPPATVGITGEHEGAANYIVPHYHETGHKTRQGLALNPEATIRMEQIMKRHGEKVSVPAPVVLNTPGSPLNGKRKTRKTTRTPQVTPQVTLPTPYYTPTNHPLLADLSITPTKITVVFVVKSATIKVLVDAVLNSETGLSLVFANEEEIRITPEQGDQLVLVLPGKVEIPVMYLGIIHQWYNSPQQLMSFIKT